MVSLEPFELLYHDRAGRERVGVRVLVWESARQENRIKVGIRSRRLARILSGRSDEVVNHFSGALDALIWNAAAMRVAQEEPSCLRQDGRIGGLGHADAQEEDQGGCDGKS